jgi:hypothetical protein
MARYQIITLVDITRTNPHRSEVDKKKISQQANFNSLLQAIGMRANASWAIDPKMHTGALPDDIDGKANHWIWVFDVERDDVFLEGDDPVALLVNDLHGVPIIDGLDNSVELSPAAFQTKGKNQNCWLTIMS